MAIKMTFHMFDTLMSASKKLEEHIKNIEDVYGVELDDGPLLEVSLNIMDLLVDECEYYTQQDTPIYDYAYKNNWGETPQEYYIEGKKYTITDTLTLYKYLRDRFTYEEDHDEYAEKDF